MSELSTRDRAIQVSRGPQGIVRAMPPAPPGGGITGKDVLRILRKRKWLIITCVALFTAAAVIVTALWLRYAPFYTATAVLRVKVPENILARTTVTRGEELDRRKATFVRLAKGQSILEKAARTKRIKATTWYQRDPQEAVMRLFEEISVSSIVDTELLQISMTGRVPGELPEIVNAVAEEFEKSSKEAARQDYFDNISELKRQAGQVQGKLNVINQEIKALRRDAPDLQRNLAMLGQQLGVLGTQREELALLHQQARQQLEAFQDQEDRELLDTKVEVLQAVYRDGTLQAQVYREASLAADAEAMREKYGDEHRYFQTLKIRLASLRKQIEERRRFVRDSALRYLKDRLTRQKGDIEAQMGSVQRRITQANRRSQELQTSLAEIEKKDGERQFLQQSLNIIEGRRQELVVSRRTAVPIRIRWPAVIPKKPSQPKWKLNIPIGVFLGLVLGIGLAFLLEFVDTSIRSPSDVAKRVDLPVLGIVPHTDDLDEEIEDLHRAFMTHPNSLLGEAFRQIRTCLLFTGPAGQTRSLLITSSQPGDGRGTVTINLAAAMAHGGRKILVVDANFRQPMIRKLFPECPEAGLSNTLVGQGNWEQLVCEIEPNLSVMGSGPMPPNPAELLGSDHMRNLLAEMTAKYDQVLFNGAPCLLVTDSSILSTLVDGVVLVVRAGANTHGVVIRARDTLKRVGARILGVVLNGIRVTAGGYLRETYRTFYEYHEQEQLPAE